MNGSAAIHDFELAVAGKTSEDVGATLHEGKFGMARETADAFAVASPRGAENEIGLGAALGRHLEQLQLPACRLQPGPGRLPRRHPLHDPRRPGHRHRPHAPARLRRGPGRGVAARLPPPVPRGVRRCSTASGSTWAAPCVLPEVLLKAVSVVRNFGHSLDGLVTVNVDKESRYRSTVNVLNRPPPEGIELTGHHEILLPLLHAAMARHLAVTAPAKRAEELARAA